MSTMSRLREIIEPIVDDLGLELFDLEFAGSTVTITIDLPPGDDRAEPPAPDAPRGIDLSDITAVTRAVSRAFDDADPIEGAYSIEVSSPGLERPLRTPLHFTRAIGQTITIKTVPGVELGRRLKGRLDAADDDGITVALEPSGDIGVIPYADIEKARTVFEWGPEPRPTKPKPVKTTKSKSAKATPKATKPKADATAAKPKQKKVTAP